MTYSRLPESASSRATAKMRLSLSKLDALNQEAENSTEDDGAQWALRFISGKYQGGEFPLRANREIVIGRSSELDMVLVEDMVSRKHAKIVTGDNVVEIEDLGSTNGTFVNGEKVDKLALKEGDRVLIGTSIIKLVTLQAAEGTDDRSLSEIEARSRMATAARPTTAGTSMSGDISEIPLPDLLQLLSTSRKSGVLVLRSDLGTGRIFLRTGQIYFASVQDAPDMGTHKAFYRMLGWNQGGFELEPADNGDVPEEIEDSTEGLLMEGMRQLDEFRVLADKLPPLAAAIRIPNPLTLKLRDLSPEELDVFQMTLSSNSVQAVLNSSNTSDLKVGEGLKTSLIEKGYLVTGEPRRR